MKELIIKISTFLVSGFALSYVFWIYKPDDLVPIKWFLIWTLPLAIVVIFLIEHLIVEKLIVNPINLPRLRTITNNRYLFESSELFSNQSLVSVYLIDDYEQLVGIGYVESVLQTKILQVIILQFHAEFDEEKMHANKHRIVLKPSITYPHGQFFMPSQGVHNE